MALFKTFRGQRKDLDNVPFVDGYAYFCPDDGSFHIDCLVDGQEKRIQLNAKNAETLTGKTLEELKEYIQSQIDNNSSEKELPQYSIPFWNGEKFVPLNAQTYADGKQIYFKEGNKTLALQANLFRLRRLADTSLGEDFRESSLSSNGGFQFSHDHGMTVYGDDRITKYPVKSANVNGTYTYDYSKPTKFMLPSTAGTLATQEWVNDYINNQGSSVTVNADYNQNDKNAIDYIKNRPFYDDYKLLLTPSKENIVYLPNKGSFALLTSDISFIFPVDTMIKKGYYTWGYWDGPDESLTFDLSHTEEEPLNDNIDLIQYVAAGTLDSMGEPINIAGWYGRIATNQESGWEVMSIYTGGLKQLDDKFISDNIVRIAMLDSLESSLKNSFESSLENYQKKTEAIVYNNRNSDVWSASGQTATYQYEIHLASYGVGAVDIDDSNLNVHGLLLNSSRSSNVITTNTNYLNGQVKYYQRHYGFPEGDPAYNENNWDCTLNFPKISGTLATEEYVNQYQMPGWKIIKSKLNHSFKTYNNTDFYHEGFADFIEYESVADSTKHMIKAYIHITSEETIAEPSDIGIKILGTVNVGNKWTSKPLYVNNVFPEGFLDNTKYTNITIDKYQWITDITDGAIGRFNSNGSVGPIVYADRPNNSFIPLVWGNGLELDTYNDGQQLIIGGKEIEVTYYDYHKVVNNKK